MQIKRLIKQTDRQTKTQVDSQNNRETGRHTEIQTVKNTDRWTNRQKTYSKTAKVWTTRHSTICTDRQKYWLTEGRQTKLQTDRDKQANKNSYRVIDKWTD